MGVLLTSSDMKRTAGRSGEVTLIQRFDSAPTTQQLQTLVLSLSERLGRSLERKGLLERELEQSYLTEAALFKPGV